MVRVLLFASLRDAAGTRSVEREEPTVAALLDALRAEHGEPFTSRLAVATVVVDGETVTHDDATSLAEAEEVALLPPFSGG